ncbi:FmtA-like protein [Microbispora rosea subsp. aerata]|nr:serine hydrolase domain-containing protein [Microbispora rosea]GGO14198.1 FmtA-like protein [Microbispora rosea subsp. aerata]GIH53864.1 FmtA-like protein [Microbispora rosea subsp. aerata]GLJ84836.1 FmtA-like protein [Microbispora rosea subsp. aerata]
MYLFRLMLAAVCAALVVLVPRPAAAATDIPDRRALADFFDAAMADGLAANHVPGAVVSVVGGGKILFSKGYGLADVENRRPFDPDTSLVRIASITKLFTWTAVMQQVQRGRLDLKADVNRYLTAFRVPETYPRPITLQDLMDHTAGFEDRTIGVGSRSRNDVPPLGDYLAGNMPARVRPPGEVSAYSNYGAALAGYIVSQVSGQPYDEYVRDHILEPLAMRHSTATEPVPAPLAADLARSYDYEDGAYRRKPFVFDNLAPDGSISATANDMAHFMIAHLRDGRFGDRRILDEPTARLMHRRSFAADPRVDGYAHGFKEQTFNGHRVLMHDGGWEGFQSALLLVPDADLGLFVSMNGMGGADAAVDVIPPFFDRFLPGERAAPDGGAPVTPVEGFYKLTRSAESSIEKVVALTDSTPLRVEGGKLVFRGSTWSPLGPGLYQQDGGTQRLAPVTGGSGAAYVATDGPAYQRVPWWDTPPVNAVVVLLFAVTALTAVLGLPVAAVIRRVRRRPVPRVWRAGRVLTWLAAVAGLAFVVLFALVLTGDTSILYGVPADVQVLLALPVLALALTATAIVTTVRGWRHAGVLARGHQVVVLAGLLAFLWFCRHWNLLGWHL